MTHSPHTPLPLSTRLAEVRAAAPDVFAELPLPLQPSLASPCWRRNETSRLRCLPAFFVAGALQSGTADLWRRLKAHSLIPSRHDALSHWWTNHPRSRAGNFETYTSRFSGDATLAALDAAPDSLLGDASPASFTFMFAESLRLHYRYLDAFDACYRECKANPPQRGAPSACANRKKGSDGGYRADHCYGRATAATSPLSFNLPAFATTLLPALRVVVMLREPAERIWLWIAFHSYGQYPAKYGQGAAGFGGYFGNQSAAWHSCASRHGVRPCALRFEGHGPEQADVYYHCDQLIKGMYSAFLPEWQAYFAPQRLLVLPSSEHFARPMRSTRLVWRWLGLREASQQEEADARRVKEGDELEQTVRRHGEAPAHHSRAVRAFYAPFNRDLAEALDDRRFYRGNWGAPS